MALFYSYRPLKVEDGEVRLLDLLPGAGDDMLRARIISTRIPIPLDPMESQLHDEEVEKLQHTMPTGWSVARTVAGRILFILGNDERTSWEHPDPTYDFKPGPRPTFRKEQPKDIPEYEALSYCWGSAEPSDVLFVEIIEGQDYSHYATLHIRPNLASALRHLRRQGASRRLWIDAVCINQTDLLERSRHVARMGTIYEFAEKVVIWLGLEESGSDTALAKFQELGRQFETLEGRPVPAPGCPMPELRKSFDPTRELLDSMSGLLRRQWFKRLWIWQEATLANITMSEVMCGDKSVPWYEFQCGFNLLFNTTIKDPILRQELAVQGSPHIKSTLKWTLQWNGIDRLIWGTSTSGCTDNRDRVYGFLSLCQPELAARIKPDYTLDVSQVYRTLIVAFLELHRNLLLLKYCDLASRTISPPTWVPDLTKPAQRPVQFCFAAGESKAEFRMIDDGTVEVTGTEAGKVLAVSGQILDGNHTTLLGAWEMLQDWYNLASKHATGSFEENFFISISNGRVIEKESGEKYSTEEFIKEYRHLSTKDGIDITDKVLADSKLIGSFVRHERAAFFISDKGFMGLAPIGTQEGDILTVLLGCLVPLVLRPTTDEKHQVVGRAYAHGLMDAQGVLGALESPWVAKVQRWTPKGDVWIFVNQESGEIASGDPRLGPLPTGWEALNDDLFRQPNGESTEHDPRWDWEHLQKRSLEWKRFQLE